MVSALTKYLEEFDFPKEYSSFFITSMHKLVANEEARANLNEHIEKYKAGELDWNALTHDATKFAPIVGIHEYTAKFLYYTALIPYSYHYFEENGLGYDEWYGSMIDFKWKVNECVSCYGIIGVFVDWFAMFFTAERVAFGRLQFNPATADYDYNSGHFNIKKGDPIVAIHIPSDTRSAFNKENREAAYKRAAAHFSKILGTKEVIFRCGTWLLHPAHRDILPEKSNIRSFLDDFELDRKSFTTDNGSNIWRIFYTRPYGGDPGALPEETSLMRTYKRFIKDGGVTGTLVGYRKEIIE